MILTKLVSETGRLLRTARFWDVERAIVTDDEYLAVASALQVQGRFTSVTRTTAGTSTIAAPDDNGSLIVSDLLISGEKQAGSSVTVQFTDGTETVTLFNASQIDAPPSFAHTFGGRVQGWRDARVDVTTTGAGDATVTLVYVKVPIGLIFAEWDAQR